MHDVLTKQEKKLFGKLNTPSKIQDFINAIPINFETGGETCMSPRRTLKASKAHCFEGALLASLILWYHGAEPLLLDLKCDGYDMDHVVAIFKQGGYLGAISKTNHAVLRYREPVYKSVRELALSYFHEYFTDKGIKTLRSYSKPFNLKRLGTDWITTDKDLWHISDAIDRSPHFPIVTSIKRHQLRKADPVEIAAGKLVEYKKGSKK